MCSSGCTAEKAEIRAALARNRPIPGATGSSPSESARTPSGSATSAPMSRVEGASTSSALLPRTSRRAGPIGEPRTGLARDGLGAAAALGDVARPMSPPMPTSMRNILESGLRERLRERRMADPRCGTLASRSRTLRPSRTRASRMGGASRLLPWGRPRMSGPRAAGKSAERDFGARRKGRRF
jgi:hypothetical protein